MDGEASSIVRLVLCSHSFDCKQVATGKASDAGDDLEDDMDGFIDDDLAGRELAYGAAADHWL